MATVTIYKVDCTRAYMMSEQGTGYSLEPWGSNTDYYEGDDDGGREYVLPDGYKVAPNTIGEPCIWDAAGRHCIIMMHSSGLPQLVSGQNKMPVLSEA